MNRYATPRQIMLAWEKNLNHALEVDQFTRSDYDCAKSFLEDIGDKYCHKKVVEFYRLVKSNQVSRAKEIFDEIMERKVIA